MKSEALGLDTETTFKHSIMKNHINVPIVFFFAFIFLTLWLVSGFYIICKTNPTIHVYHKAGIVLLYYYTLKVLKTKS